MTRSAALPALILAGAVSLIGSGIALAQQPLRVVTTINPIHALVAGVMEGVAKPELILRGAASPYTYVMRSSEARTLNRADVVFFVGEGLESFLIRSLETLPPDSRVVELIAIDGLTLLPPRKGAAWEDEELVRQAKTADNNSAGGPGTEDPDPDPHIWLDPANAQVMVAAIADELADADPEREPIYHRNAEALVRRLQALDRELNEATQPVRNLPFVVFHDAYQYLEKRYGLTAVGAVTARPDQRPSSRRIKDLHDKVMQMGAICVFGEPQATPAPVRGIIEGTRARTAVLDALGANVPETAEAYFSIMRGLVATLRGCLLPKG
ncbi:MAG: zinc ABC transporter substrate-binding protein [Proteobacteria bacterium]|nr:zinc ABC transporter substrate-binding protein [Pseudomonadota bacterium]MBI3497525.1 zinc ABC transporter substrate-binding protein [Pseudomonadota bacterium]